MAVYPLRWRTNWVKVFSVCTTLLIVSIFVRITLVAYARKREIGEGFAAHNIGTGHVSADAIRNASDGESRQRLLFHLVWTTNADVLPEVAALAVRSVCRFHPDADVHFWILDADKFRNEPPRFECNVQYKALDLTELFAGLPISTELFTKSSRKTRKYHIADSARLVLVYKFGGIYLDTDIIILRHLAGFSNSLGFQDEDFVNNALMIFDKGHPFIRFVIGQIPGYYNARLSNALGPRLLTDCVTAWWKQKPNNAIRLDDPTSARRIADAPQSAIFVYGASLFYPIDYMFDMSTLSEQSLRQAVRGAYTFHLWSTMIKGNEEAKQFFLTFFSKFVGV
ncbi:PREDICTED: lactosylceramide 4-alpha-galactosyltransferase-like [Priapulus caudatus]|uniref:Lactosylceramide 4-alpha-galactosyltransferase-like n=1 Tax=Priapulus caudatus TaxID=37621 RepID=A0ABM1E925_PRICU|nr:PREDICTED: lactosylceramide 4-alpha-galactosyltransferase-like [Priapulus caudatus]